MHARSRLFLFGLWIALLLVPTSVVPPMGSTWDGRLVYHVLPAVALLLVEALTLLRRPVLRSPWLLLLPLVWGISALPVIGGYRHAGAAVQSFGASLAAAAETASPQQPVGVAAFSLTQPQHNVQILQRKAWGLLTNRPFAERDLAVVSLESVLPDFGVAAARVDATPAAAILAAGGSLLSWSDFAARTFRRPDVPAPAELVAHPAGGGRFTAPSPWLPYSATVVEVEFGEPVQACSLRFDGAIPGLESASREARSDAGATRFWFDVGSSPVGLVLMNFAMPWPDVVLSADGAPVPRGTKVFLRTPEELVLAEPLRGREVALEQLAAALRPPAPGARLYLMLPLTTVSVDAPPDGVMVLSEAARHELSFLRSLLPGAHVYYCWKTGGDAGPVVVRQSVMDWFALR